MRCPKCNAETSSDSLYCHRCGTSLSTKVGHASLEETKDFGEDISFFFSPGDNFGKRYKIIEEIGRGGMGRVYKAEDKVLHTVVALKMIRPEFLADSSIIDRFKKELLLAREIAHENVVRIYDFGEVKGVKFISMQYVEGKSLKKLIEESGPLPLEKVKETAKQICRGLLAAHKRGIIHRDLKPHNIMIDKDDNVYITDFGLAVSDKGTGISQLGTVIGTPQYIAPEQWLGEKIDNRADIYTLGIIMYEMITGSQPFVSDSDIGYFQKHLKEKPVFPDVSTVKVPAYFKKIVKKCLEKKREYRYQDAEEILSDISCGTFPRNSISHWFGKNRLLKKMAASLFILLAFYGIYRLMDGLMKRDILFNPAKKRTLAILPFENRTGDNSLNYLRFTISILLQADLEQSKYFLVFPEDHLFHIWQEVSTEASITYSEKVNKIGSQANVKYLITGNFIKAGEKLVIKIRIRDLLKRGGNIGTDSEYTEPDNISPAIDRLTLKIKKRLKLTGADFDQDIDKITTSSQKALALYVQGKQKFHEEEYEESIELFKQAVEKDPGFAMAYKEMAWTYAYTPNLSKRREAFEKARKHSKNLSEKERLLIEGYCLAEYEETYAQAIGVFESLLKIYPNDYEANTQLGMIFYHIEEWDKAIRYLKKAADATNPDYQPYASLASTYLAKGMVKRAREVIDNYHKTYPEKTILQEFKYDSYIIERNFERAAVERENIEKKNGESKYRQGELYFYQGNLKSAAREFDKIKITEEIKAYQKRNDYLRLLYLLEGKFNISIKLLKENIRLENVFDYKIMYVLELAHLLFRLNKPRQALEEIEKHITKKEKTLQPYHSRIMLFFESLIYLELKQFDKLEAHLSELKEYIDKSIFKKDMKYYYFIDGLSARKDKNFKLAISNLENAFSCLPSQKRNDFFGSKQALFLYELAVAYYEFGDLNLASSGFKEITSLTFGRFYFGDLYAKSFYYLGKSYQKKGWNGKAMDMYEEFLQLWQDSDPGYWEKEKRDARKQLEILNR